MRRGNQSKRFQICHDVAYRGGAEFQTAIAGECARTDRSAVLYVTLDQNPEQPLGPG